MEATLLKLKPELLWKHFYEISKIPHGSKNEKEIGNYIIRIAKENNLEYKQDKAGNVVVTKPASSVTENLKTVSLQSHMDMVCEKNKDIVHDFTKDPLKLKLEGNILKAEGTTLGADNGVGVATQLALMEDKTLKHGKLEFLFTVDEETGLTGAQNLSSDFLTAKTMINLDSETLGAYCIGCAGGQDTVGTLKLNFTKTNVDNPVLIKLEIKGLIGGHSGLDIDKGRANALKILGRLLFKLNSAMKLDLVSIEGGSRRNVISREAFTQVVIPQNQISNFENIVKQTEKNVQFEYKNTDAQIKIQHTTLKDTIPQVIVNDQKNKIINLLNSFIHGVLSMSADIPGLVETSTNLAVVAIEGDTMKIETSQRSAIDSAKHSAACSVRAGFALAGFDAQSGNGYPGWAPNAKSKLVELCMQLNKKHLGREAVIEAVHAGLECGIIGEKFPGMEMVSMGATFWGVHSPDEQLDVNSVEPFWNLLAELILEAGKLGSDPFWQDWEE